MIKGEKTVKSLKKRVKYENCFKKSVNKCHIEYLPVHFVKLITLIPKPDKDNTRQLQTNIAYEYRCKNTRKLYLGTYKKDYTP